MKLFSFILILALAIPVSASSVVSWTQTDIPGYNLTLNYTSEFNVAKDDLLGISIENIGNESENDIITIYKIQVKSSSEADGIWTGSVTIEPNSSDIINLELNVTTDDEETVNIKVYYYVNSETNTLDIKAYYPGESDSPIEEEKGTILAWSPQVVDYVYVNDTISETIEYSITTAEPMTTVKWSKDGLSVEGESNDNPYTYTKNWTNDDLGFHTVIFKGSNANTNVEFRWHVNVYKKGGYAGGGLFDVIDEALEHHATDIKIQIFKYKRAKYGSNSGDTADYVNRLHDGIAKRQMTRKALRDDFKAGDISIAEYVAALKKIKKDVKYDLILAKKITEVEQGKDGGLEDEYYEEYDEDYENELKENNAKNKKKEESGNKGKGNKNRIHDDEDEDN